MSLIGEAETVVEGATGTWWLKLLPYVAAFAGAAALLYGAYSWAYSRGSHSRDAEVAQLTLRATTAEASVAALRSSLDQQNAAVQQQADAAAAKIKATQDALAAATAREKASQALADRLTASAAQKPVAGKECSFSGATEAAWPGK